MESILICAGILACVVGIAALLEGQVNYLTLRKRQLDERTPQDIKPTIVTP